MLCTTDCAFDGIKSSTIHHLKIGGVKYTNVFNSITKVTNYLGTELLGSLDTQITYKSGFCCSVNTLESSTDSLFNWNLKITGSFIGFLFEILEKLIFYFPFTDYSLIVIV